MSDTSLESYGDLADGVAEIVLSERQIQERIAELGLAISRDYAGLNPLLVGVLKGVLFFMADLLRHISIPMEVDFMAVTSYSPESRDKGLVRMVKDLEIPIQNRHVLFVEDVIDTGLTLNYLLRNLRARQPASLEVCALFNKGKKRLIDLPVKYQGFDLPDLFMVGYGLDYREKYRNLPFLGLLKAEVFQQPVSD
ncbi:MAG: hypoxanthine phosphoribosyltransferase [Anaerolineales bacterium]|jgi:hypoxanthine phosphoribosyltransferase